MRWLRITRYRLRGLLPAMSADHSAALSMTQPDTHAIIRWLLVAAVEEVAAVAVAVAVVVPTARCKD